MKVSPQLQAVVLTGYRPCHNVLLRGAGVKNKALLPLLGLPLLDYVLSALAKSSVQPEVFLCENDAQVRAFAAERAIPCLPSASQGVRSLLKSLECLPGDGPVLFTTGDHPLLTAEMVDYFLDEAMDRGLALAVATVRRSVVQYQQPKSRRTYMAMKDGVAHSGGNLFLIDRRQFQANSALMAAVERNRKAPWRNTFLFDPLTALRLLFRQLDIHQAANLAALRFGCPVGVVEMPFAECCMDVDKPSDLLLAEQIMRQRHLRDKLMLDDQSWSTSYA